MTIAIVGVICFVCGYLVRWYGAKRIAAKIEAETIKLRGKV